MLIGQVYATQSSTMPSDISNYNYFGLQDRFFESGFDHWKPEERNAREDGEPLTQQDISNDKLWLKLHATSDLGHTDFSVTAVTQGTKIHTAKETNDNYKLLGYNIIGSVVPIDAILITRNNTAKWNDLFLYARLKLINAEVIAPGGVGWIVFSIGIAFNWQFEYYNYDDDKYYWSDFHNPDPYYGSRMDGTSVSGITSDIPLNSQQFILGVGWIKWVWQEIHQESPWYNDVVINPLGKYAQKVDAGIWQDVRINMSEYITDIFNKANTLIDFQYNDETAPNADYTALALRGISIYIEGINVDVEAEIDYVLRQPALFISASFGGTTDPVPGTYTYSYGSSVTVTASAYSSYTFDYWLLDGSPIYDNPITVMMDSDHTLEAHFKYSSGGGGGGSGGWPPPRDQLWSGEPSK